MSEQGKRLQKRKEEDAAFNKMLLWLAGSVVLEGLTLLLRRFYIDFSYTDLGLALAEGLDAFFGVFRFLGVVLFIAGCVWTFLWARSGKKKLLPVVLTCVVLWLWVASVLCYGLNQLGMTLLCALPVAVAVLSAIFFLYQREFFVSAVFCALGLLGIKLLPRVRGASLVGYAYAVALAVLLVAAVVLFRMMQKSQGKLTVKGAPVQVFPKGANYALLYVTCALVAVVAIAAVMMGALTLLYGVLVAWLLILAVYYTVRLM